jgi:hypothetical protein
MSDFEIGALYWPSEDEANLEILETGASQMAQGSKDMVVAILSACNVSGEIAGWSIRPTRSYFFSGFPDSHSWQDRWRKGWTLTAKFNRISSRADASVFAPGKPLDVCDPTWVYDHRIIEDSREKFTLIAKPGEFSKDGKAAGAEQVLGEANDVLRNFKIATTFNIPNYIVLKLVFPLFDENEERRVVTFISELRRRGYLTHWHDML